MPAKLIVCLTGMPGSGKSTIAAALKSGGLDVVVMGDEVRAEAARQGLEPTRENLGKIMLDLRKKDGPAAVAKLVGPAIQKASSDTVIVDGARSNEEIEFFRSIGEVRTLLVHASTDRRFGFLSERGRSDDPKNRGNFDDRDAREIGVGISTSIALADESVSNNSLSIAELTGQALEIIRGWEK